MESTDPSMQATHHGNGNGPSYRNPHRTDNAPPPPPPPPHAVGYHYNNYNPHTAAAALPFHPQMPPRQTMPVASQRMTHSNSNHRPAYFTNDGRYYRDNAPPAMDSHVGHGHTDDHRISGAMPSLPHPAVAAGVNYYGDSLLPRGTVNDNNYYNAAAAVTNNNGDTNYENNHNNNGRFIGDDVVRMDGNNNDTNGYGYGRAAYSISAAAAASNQQQNQGTNTTMSQYESTISGNNGGSSIMPSTAITAVQQVANLMTLPSPDDDNNNDLPSTIKQNNDDAVPNACHHPDVPFLITHWLDHYVNSTTSLSSSGGRVSGSREKETGGNQDNDDAAAAARKKEAMRRLRNAAKDVAWAFETLGVFGTTATSGGGHGGHGGGGGPLYSTDGSNEKALTTYTDLKRKYHPILLSRGFASANNAVSTRTNNSNNSNNGNKHHEKASSAMALLDSIVSASASASNEATKSVLETVVPWSLLEAAYEGTVPTISSSSTANSGSSGVAGAANTVNSRQSTNLGVGRRVGEESLFNSDSANASLENLFPANGSFGSSIQNPVLMGGSNTRDGGSVPKPDYSSATDGALVMTLGSNFEMATKKAAEASRTYLTLRSKLSDEIRDYQTTRLAMQSAIVKADSHRGSALLSVELSGGHSESLDPQRVIAQLQRRLGEMHLKISAVQKESTDAKNEADKAYRELSSIRMYRDPYRVTMPQLFSAHHRSGRTLLSHPTILKSGCLSQPRKNRNFVLPGILSRQYRDRRQPSDFANVQLSVLKSRLSHAVTINCHLVYPVYCLKFDKSGKYFITGADDQLVKLFHLGAGPRNGERPMGKRFSYGANTRGAVLVCTLRGHAGVVTDVDVSVDNALLATASADGDVRVWGLRDGCPVAILRGHKDGANMVSFFLYLLVLV